ncbi:MAG: DNA/RNA nuclease SfsA [Acidimicrobiales bacterium]|nr:DNA/RNA nuclease SfsA [Hyphomonadaceae bacterium]RZV41069.1 MAG: DNA/RNA nuclease SfsA [Acidimicrobiales bacterium]
MIFETPLLEGRLIERYKRFFADIELSDGEIITAHCANTGSMAGLKEPGNRAWVSPVNNPKRKLQYDWHLVEAGGALVGINTSWPNKLVAEALENKVIPELHGYETVRPEVKYGENSRIDFLLESADRRPCYVEVKNITYSRDKGLAEFPDAKTARGTKHLHEMTSMVEQGARAVMLYVVQRNDCDHFQIAADVDPEYDFVLKKAQQAGVESLCYACHMSPEEIRVSNKIIVHK